MTKTDLSKHNTPFDNFMLNVYIPLFAVFWLFSVLMLTIVLIVRVFGPPLEPTAGPWFKPANFALQDLGGIGFLLLLAAIGFVVAQIVRRFP